MTDLQRTARVAELQSYLRNQPRLKLEFLASMSKLFRDHSIDLPHEVLGSLTLTLDRARRGPDVDVDGPRSVTGMGDADLPTPQPTHDDLPTPQPTHDDLPTPQPTHFGDDDLPTPQPTV